MVGLSDSPQSSPLLANLYLHWFDALFYGPQGPGQRADVKLVGQSNGNGRSCTK